MNWLPQFLVKSIPFYLYICNIKTATNSKSLEQERFQFIQFQESWAGEVPVHQILRVLSRRGFSSSNSKSLGQERFQFIKF
jgi:hypothetical protein